MARMTEEQMRNLLRQASIKRRAQLAGIAPMNEETSKADNQIYSQIDAARMNGVGTHRTHKETETAVARPDFIPDRIEDSGLIVPGMVLDESQKRALEIVHHAQYSALIGAAGTGKTTMVKRCIANHIYGGDGMEKRGIKRHGSTGLTIAMVAFSGMATQVMKAQMPDWLKPSVSTVHSLLEFAPNIQGEADSNGSVTSFIPRRHAGNPLPHNRIFIDEASQIGSDLWHLLLDALLPGTSITLIGDLNQLVPIGDSPFFPAALHEGARHSPDVEGVWQIAKLTKIHRQQGVGANRIIDAAHNIIVGKRPTFDLELDGKTGQPVDELGRPAKATPNPDWRIINIHLPSKTDEAHRVIMKWLQQFHKAAAKQSTDGRRVYEPAKDLILTPGNGWELDQPGAMIQQGQLNPSISRIFSPNSEETPTYKIDACFETRRYTVGDRVLCLKNEAPDVKERITNGMRGTITDIKPNGEWHGDTSVYGRLDQLNSEYDDEDFGMIDLSQLDTSHVKPVKTNDRRRNAQPASHIVTIRFDNGQERVYNTGIGVATTQLGYAVTTQKAQGSQAETVFVVAHGTTKRALNREWLYTSVTRAQQRVIVFSDSLGLRTGLARQQLPGATIEEKIERFNQKCNTSGKHIRLYI